MGAMPPTGVWPALPRRYGDRYQNQQPADYIYRHAFHSSLTARGLGAPRRDLGDTANATNQKL
jgi:hypothetical protein